MHRRSLISKRENRYKTRGENNTQKRTTQQVTTKSEFDERLDKNTGIKKKLRKRILLPRIDNVDTLKQPSDGLLNDKRGV